MASSPSDPKILQSVLDWKQVYEQPWIEKWTVPNPFLASLSEPLRKVGVAASDMSCNSQSPNLADWSVNIVMRALRAVVTIRLDSFGITANELSWDSPPRLVEVVDHISNSVHAVTGATPVAQVATLGFHVVPGESNFAESTARLVNKALVGECEFYGIGLYRTERTLVIDRSQAYPGAAFVRVERNLSGSAGFAAIVAHLLEDQLEALRFLGINALP